MVGFKLRLSRCQRFAVKDGPCARCACQLLCPTGTACQKPVNPSAQKYSCFQKYQITRTFHPFRFGRRGVSPTSRNVKRNAMDAAAAQGEATLTRSRRAFGGCGFKPPDVLVRPRCDGEIVWSWRAHAGAQV